MSQRIPAPLSDARVFWLVVGFGVVSHLLMLWWISRTGGGFWDGLAVGTDHSPLYREAVTTYFWQHLWFTHTVPPLAVIRDGLAHTFFPPDGIFHVLSASVAVIDCFSGGLAYLLARLTGLRAWLAAAIGAVVSCRLILWATWGFGTGWDAYNPFLVLLFAVALLSVSRRRRADGHGAPAPPGRC